jgi:DNA-binding LacI/PurR family transcriptional regulator
MKMKEIAKMCDVSISTVSRVLNNKSGVRDEVREKVLKVIKETDFTPNIYAQSLTTKKTKTIGVFIPGVDTYFRKIIFGITDFFSKKNYSILLSADRYKSEVENIEFLLNKNVDGIIYFPWYIDNSIDGKIKEFGNKKPFVIIDYEFKDIPCVIQDHYSSMKEIVEFYLKNDKKNLLFINGQEYNYSSQIRKKSFENTLKNNNIHNYKILEGSFSIDESYKIIENFFNNNKISDYDGIICCNDSIAISCISYLKSVNVNIPKRVWISGFDDMDIVKYITPSLTSVSYDKYQLGYNAAVLLYQQIKSTNSINKISMNYKIVYRNSTGG